MNLGLTDRFPLSITLKCHCLLRPLSLAPDSWAVSSELQPCHLTATQSIHLVRFPTLPDSTGSSDRITALSWAWSWDSHHLNCSSFRFSGCGLSFLNLRAPFQISVLHKFLQEASSLCEQKQLICVTHKQMCRYGAGWQEESEQRLGLGNARVFFGGGMQGLYRHRTDVIADGSLLDLLLFLQKCHSSCWILLALSSSLCLNEDVLWTSTLMYRWSFLVPTALPNNHTET